MHLKIIFLILFNLLINCYGNYSIIDSIINTFIPREIQYNDLENDDTSFVSVAAESTIRPTTPTTTTIRPDETTSPTAINSNLWNPLTWFNSKSIDIPYNPDADLNTCEIAIRHGYSAEAHTVETEDGYLLTLHRIPCGKNGCDKRGTGIPVFLQHGLLSSSADWLISGPDKSLAFILADIGYDVWLGNARGNTYSKGHIKFKHNDNRYWDFSWHEMALYDVPAEIDYIYKIKKMNENSSSKQLENNLLYVGHSMGTTMLFAMLAMRPEYNSKINAGFALAPVAYMNHVKSPIRLLAPFSNDIQLISVSNKLEWSNEYLKKLTMPNWVDNIIDTLLYKVSLRLLMIVKFLGGNEFLPHSKIIEILAKYGCDLTFAERYICKNTIFVLCGFDKEQFNETLMPVIFGHTPAGTSTKTIVHYAQEIHESGNFQYFDYGSKENEVRYGQSTPPQYNISNIETPIALFYAENDWLAGPKDVEMLFDKLHKTSMGMFSVPFEQFNHVDFMWGKDAPHLVYDQLIELMKRYS